MLPVVLPRPAVAPMSQRPRHTTARLSSLTLALSPPCTWCLLHLLLILAASLLFLPGTKAVLWGCATSCSSKGSWWCVVDVDGHCILGLLACTPTSMCT